MQKYKQISYDERVLITFLLKEGKSKSEIALKLGRNKSSIYRDIAKNSSEGTYKLYNATPADKRRNERRINSNRKKDITPEMKSYIETKLTKEQWSPEQIAGRCKAKGIDMVSHETIYQFIYEDKKEGGDLYVNLRRGHRKRKCRRNQYKQRGIIKDRVSIEQRPKIVEEQKRYGDWEGDTIIGKNHKGAIITLVERKSLYLKIAKTQNKEADITASKITQMMNNIKDCCNTITFDNGKEFARHKDIAAKLDADIFFAHPYSSFERGCNENSNGLLRQYFPKGSSFDALGHGDIIKVQGLLNNRPRKKLCFLTPNEIFSKFVALRT